MSESSTIPNGLPMDRAGVFDPSGELAALRQSHPISPMTYFPGEQKGWLVTSHELVRRVFTEPRLSAGAVLTAAPIPQPGFTGLMNTLLTPGTILRMDPPDHTRIRRMLTGSFTVKRMKNLEPAIAEIVDEQLDAIAETGPPAELVSTFALPVPSAAICVLLGVPQADRPAFESDAKLLLSLDAEPQEMQAAHRRLADHIRQLGREKRRNPAEDLLSDLAVRDDLELDELVGIGLILLIGGHETTMNMLALGTFALLEHPDQLQLLRDKPSLMPGAVEELLRHLAIIHIGPMRVATQDLEIGGVTIRAGETVTVSIPAANRDPQRFDDPERLDVSRAGASHLAFGHGVHQCIGQQLARIEMRIGFARLIERFPQLRLAIPAAEVPLRTDMSIYGVHELPVIW